MASNSSRFTTHRSHKQARKKQSSRSIDEHSLKLPELYLDLILKILLRLPVKSLIRFKSVCKSWQTEISSPKFVKEHLSFVTTGDTINPWRIMVRYSFRNLKSYSLDSLFNKPHRFVVRPDFPYKVMPESARIVGSCNGLVCIYLWQQVDTFYIWNPSTRETRETVALSTFGKQNIVGISFGFGYDSSNDDYKVVRVANDGGCLVEVYSSRKDSWRRIGYFPSNLIVNHFAQAGIFVNGSIHWAATNPRSHSWSITALDLSEETYREVPHPHYVSIFRELSVIALRGRLCIVCGQAYRSVDLWAMNEYGIKESWSKLVSMPWLPGHGPFQHPKPLWCLKNGVILVETNGVFGIYDSVKLALKYPLRRGTRGFYQTEIYVESLVSLNAFKNVPTGLDE